MYLQLNMTVKHTTKMVDIPTTLLCYRLHIPSSIHIPLIRLFGHFLQVECMLLALFVLKANTCRVLRFTKINKNRLVVTIQKLDVKPKDRAFFIM